MHSSVQSVLSIVFVSLIFMNSAHSQKVLNWEAGINIGVYTYQGDLTPSVLGSTATPGSGISLFANRLMSPSFALRSSLSFAKLKANDAVYAQPDWRQQRNFNFHTSVVEISEMASWNLLGAAKSFSNFPLRPYLLGGLGLTLLNIKRNAASFNAEYFAAEPKVVEGLASDLNQAPPWALVVVPLGAGVRFQATRKLGIQAEAIYRYTTSDYLDGFSKAAGANRKDSYTSSSLGLIYTFGSKGAIYCPPVRK